MSDLTIGRKPFAHISYFQSEEAIQAEREEPMTTPSDTPKGDAAYCKMIEQAKRDECLGWEAKVASGVFTLANLDAHIKRGEWYGKHLAYTECEPIIAQLQRDLAAALERIAILQQDCRNLTEKVIPGINERAESALAQEREARERAEKELQLRRKPMNYPGDEEAVRQSGVRLPFCSCVGRRDDDPHKPECEFWNGVLSVRRQWIERHVVAWSCWSEANVGKSTLANGKCNQWCGNQHSCPASTRDEIEIAVSDAALAEWK